MKTAEGYIQNELRFTIEVLSDAQKSQHLISNREMITLRNKSE